jgi:hypothetical protein
MEIGAGGAGARPASPREGGGTLELVYCSDCGTPHHRECFEYNRSCSIYACKGLRYSREGRGGRDVEVITIAMEPQSASRDTRARQAPPGPRGPSSGASVRLVLDVESFSESAVKTLVAVAIAACILWLVTWLPPKRPIPGHRGLPLEVGAGCLAALLVAWLMHRSTDCYFVVDQAARVIYYHRKILGWTRLIPRLEFDRVRTLELRTRQRYRPASSSKPEHYYDQSVLYAVDHAGRRHVLMGPADPDRGNGLGQWPSDLERRGQEAADILGVGLARSRQRYAVWAEPRTYLYLFGWFGVAAFATLHASAAGAAAFDLVTLWIVFAVVPKGPQ